MKGKVKEGRKERGHTARERWTKREKEGRERTETERRAQWLEKREEKRERREGSEWEIKGARSWVGVRR